MARRPKPHVTGDVAANYVSGIFLGAGWTCDPVRSDYGEDLAVRVFEDEIATPKLIYVQSKGTEVPIKWDKHGCYRLSLGSTAIALWQSFRIPVIVTLYDKTNGKAYWQCVQDYLGGLPSPIANSTSSILISRNGELTSQSIQQIWEIATDFFKRGDQGFISFVQEKLRSKYGLEVDLDKGECSFWPSGRFEPDGGMMEAVLSGGTLRLLEWVSEVAGTSVEQVFPELLRGVVHTDIPKPSSKRVTYRDEEFRNGRVYWEVYSAREQHIRLRPPPEATD